MSVFAASTSGLVAVHERAARAPIHDVPNGLERAFNEVTELNPGAVAALLKVFEAHNVECDPRNRAVLIRNLRDMHILGASIVTALEKICGSEAADFAEKVYSCSAELAQAVHDADGATTFSRDTAYFTPFQFSVRSNGVG
jgi:hypothetical protein